ncbi:hypothetical protein [Mesorhizobium sp. CN2-181]|uniref:hypothetical protein n=1 Tax=Mesorhizobium yinganensis TaxID=3157707 RepID=UPI0032B704E4
MMELLKRDQFVQAERLEDNKTPAERQIDIETLFHKNQLMPRIYREFEDCPVFRPYMEERGIDPDFGFSLLVQMVLHKRATLPTLVGCLRNHFDGDCQKTADALLLAAQHDLVDWNPVQRQFIIIHDITPDVQADLDRYQFPLPMVVQPKELKTNRDTGYYTGSGSVILKKNHHEEDVCLDHLNRANQVRYRINQDVATKVKNQWRNLDKQKPDEEKADFLKRVKAFEKYDRTAHDVMDTLGLTNEGEFYLTHRYDKRGRTYSGGYHVNYQGNAWNKATIELADGEIIQ